LKVLLLSNIVPNCISSYLGCPVSVFGGWIDGMLDTIMVNSNLSFGFCVPLGNSTHGIIGQNEYYGFKPGNPTEYNQELEAHFLKIVNRYQPDIIDIFGTEYPHTLSMVNACEKAGVLSHVIINIQGLVSVYSENSHVFASLPQSVIKACTFRNFVKHDGLRSMQRRLKASGEFEKEAIKKVENIIGRTDWDYSCIKAINSKATYFFCGETLRTVFYESQKWSSATCKKHSIFISQTSSPIKGFHFLLEAMPNILSVFPDAHIFATGQNPCFDIPVWKQTAYQRYIVRLISNYGLESKVTFTGQLDAGQMCNQYLESNVFVLPSSIENSPNSLGEAMLLGVPCVAACVGGVQSMMIHERDGYIYQHDAPYMLAYYVCKTFSDECRATELSKSAIEHASQSYSPEFNAMTLLNTYKTVCEKANENFASMP